MRIYIYSHLEGKGGEFEDLLNIPHHFITTWSKKTKQPANGTGFAEDKVTTQPAAVGNANACDRFHEQTIPLNKYLQGVIVKCRCWSTGSLTAKVVQA